MTQRMPAECKKPATPQILAALALHAAITAVTWRDIRRRSADQVRGSKNLWRAASALNTVGAAAYFTIGRKRSRSG
jgi:hypothetical protein